MVGLCVVVLHIAVDVVPSDTTRHRSARETRSHPQPRAQYACAQMVVLAGLLVVWVTAKKVVSNPAAYVSATHIFAPRSSRPAGNV
jgi:hypothetical protein